MQKRRFISVFSLLCLLSGILSFSALGDTTGGGKVNADLLNLRASPGMSGAIVDVIPRDSFLLLEGNENDWYKVAYNGKSGYVSAEYVKALTAVDGEYDFPATVKGSSVRMRSLPNTESQILGVYNAGDPLKILGVSGNWLKVAAPEGASGYIRSDLVVYIGTAPSKGESPEKSAGSAAQIPAPADTKIGTQIVETAKQYLGCSYIWGGMSPETGFDCSGFVNYVYKLHGYSMERVAQNIYNKSGVSVPLTQLQPGDILCFGSSGSSIFHVGIYIGDGQFIHASTYDTGVIISDLSTSYFATRLMGAKRIA